VLAGRIVLGVPAEGRRDDEDRERDDQPKTPS
jgi:hypothetical protein